MIPSQGVSVDLARRLAPHLIAPSDATPGRERPITVDQTNVSVVVDERVIVKWFDPPAPHPHPGLDVLAHLAENGFDEVPRLHGVEVGDGVVTATVSEYLVEALDGWEWFVDELLADDPLVHDDPAARIDAAAVVVGGVAVEWARRSGALAARLHLALATPSSVVPDPVGIGAVRPELERCRRLLDDATQLTTPAVRTVLEPRIDLIAAAIESLGAIDSTPVQRIHDDLHIGQFLRAGDRLVVTDFDGNPIGAPQLAGERRPTAVDVASLVQSIDHAGRIAIKRHPERAGAIETRIAASSDALLDAYRRELRRADRGELLDERLLAAFRIAQELHELVYADRHLPRWTYAPLATLTALLP